MRDFVPALELACKSARSAFSSARAALGAVGALTDAVVAPRSSAASARSADCEGVASVEQQAPAPSHPEPAAEFDWMTWVQPAICDVLAEHNLIYHDDEAMYECMSTNYPFGKCQDFGDEIQWREHIAPLIAQRIHAAALAQDARLRMQRNVAMAAEFFPQK